MVEHKLYDKPITSSKYYIGEVTLETILKATNNFNEKNEIGRGGFSIVYKGNINKNIVAIKKLTERPDINKQLILYALKQEIHITSNLNHPNIIKLFGYCYDNTCPCIVYEYFSKGDLTKYIDSDLEWNIRIRMCYQICSALAYMHQPSLSASNGIIHRDLKPSNIFLDDEHNAIVADFGLSRILNNNNTNSAYGKGTFLYMEYHYDADFGQQVPIDSGTDVYSFGLIMLQLLTKTKDVKHILEILVNNRKNNKQLDIDGAVEHFVQNISTKYKNFPPYAAELTKTAVKCEILRLNMPKQSKRITVTEILDNLDKLLIAIQNYNSESSFSDSSSTSKQSELPLPEYDFNIENIYSILTIDKSIMYTDIDNEPLNIIYENTLNICQNIDSNKIYKLKQDILMNIGISLMYVAKYQIAKEYFLYADKLYEPSYISILYYSICCMHLNDYHIASNTLYRTANKDKTKLEYLLCRAACLYNKMSPESKEYNRKLINYLHKNDYIPSNYIADLLTPDFSYFVGNEMYKLSKYETARIFLRSSLRLKPNDKRCKKYLSNCIKRQKSLLDTITQGMLE